MIVTTLMALVSATLQPADPALLKKLEEIDARAAAIRTLSAEFEQRKRSPLLREPMVSSGTVRISGPVIRWDTTRPRPSVVRIDEREVRVFYPEEKLIEVYTVDEQLRQMMASPLPRLARIREKFEIREGVAGDLPVVPSDPSLTIIRLTPREEPLRKHIVDVVVAIDPATGMTRAMRLTDPDGEQTEIVFRNAKANPELAEGALDLHTPEGTKVSRPLEGLAPGGGP